MLDSLGVPGIPKSRQRAEDDEAMPAWNASLVHLLSSFTGPQGGLLQTSIGGPEQEGASNLSVLSKLAGLRLQPNQPEKFERSAKARESKKKADKTRKRNYER